MAQLRGILSLEIRLEPIPFFTSPLEETKVLSTNAHIPSPYFITPVKASGIDDTNTPPAFCTQIMVGMKTVECQAV